jgi:hypothetical protein
VGPADRQGAIVKGEHGLPVRERSYRKGFRQIARAAGIPDEVWSTEGTGMKEEAEGTGMKIVSERSAEQIALNTRPANCVGPQKS